MVQFCKIKLSGVWTTDPLFVEVISIELLTHMDYLKFIQDSKRWDKLINNGYLNVGYYYYININHEIENNPIINYVSKYAKRFLRDKKLKLLLK